jgi:tetratricopeptide (TPR) repeat protein
VEADPELALARHGLGSMYAVQGRAPEAIRELRLALALEPTRLDSAVVLSDVLIEAGELEEAEQVLRNAVVHAPANPRLSEALARVILADSSDPARTAEAARLALLASQAADFSRPSALVTLATALAAQGQYERAIELLRTARSLPETEGDSELRRRIVSLLTTYLDR